MNPTYDQQQDLTDDRDIYAQVVMSNPFDPNDLTNYIRDYDDTEHHMRDPMPSISAYR